MKKLFLGLAAMLIASPVFSQNIAGTVSKVGPGLVVVDVWGDDLKKNFYVTGTPQLQQINSLADLKAGDKVSLVYNGHDYKIASKIISLGN